MRETPAKTKTAADGYQTRPVGGLPHVPAMDEDKVTNPPSAGAAPTGHGGAPLSADGSFLD